MENNRDIEHKESQKEINTDTRTPSSRERKDSKSDEDDRRHRRRHRFKHRKKREVSFDAVSECRKMFRHEMIVLAKEVEQFRIVCDAQIEKYHNLVQEEKNKYQKIADTKDVINGRVAGEDNMDEVWRSQLSSLQADMEYLERKQLLLDKEQKLVSKEDELSRRQKDLEEYEQEIEEVERILDKRQGFCDKRQRDIDDLEEDLRDLKYDMQEEKEKLENDGGHTERESRTAKQNWKILQNALMEKQTDLEGSLLKYKTDLTTANSNIAAKDLIISKLQMQLKFVKEDIENKDKKIRQLESHLAMTIDEARHLENQIETVKHEKEQNGHTKLTPRSSYDSLEGSLNRHKGSFKKKISMQTLHSSDQDIHKHRHDHVHSSTDRTGTIIHRHRNYSRSDSNMSSASGATSSTCSVM